VTVTPLNGTTAQCGRGVGPGLRGTTRRGEGGGGPVQHGWRQPADSDPGMPATGGHQGHSKQGRWSADVWAPWHSGE
jgi:hypothetical protein